MATKDYWAQRNSERLADYGNLTHQYIMRKYKQSYLHMMKEVEHLMSDLYLKITIDGTPSANELYKYKRYYEMHEELKGILNRYGKDWYSITNRYFKQLYEDTCKVTLSTYNYKHLDNNVIDKWAKSLWNTKGKYWSKNVWCKPPKGVKETPLNASQRQQKQLMKLQTTLERGLLDCVGRGAPKDDLVATIRDRCNVQWNEADRLVRTELTHLQNQATLESYEKSGVKQYRYLAHEDNRTSEICLSLNNKIFDCNKAEVGVNYPPMHPYCRSTTIPVVNGYAPMSNSKAINEQKKYLRRKAYEDGVLKYNPKSKIKRYT